MQQSLFPQDTERTAPATIFSIKTLNEAQLAAVTHGEGPVLVIAGAGSGKTRTLVYRVAWLIDQGVDPSSILLLTFTRRAAQEMLLRATELVDASCQQVWGGTFHAVGNTLLRRYGQVLGYPSNFTILDRSDSEGIINLLRSSMDVAGSGRRFPGKKALADIFSRALNRNLAIEELVSDQYPHFETYTDDILVIAEQYRQFKFDHGLMDYDDLLVNWRRLLAEHPEIGEAIADRFRYILVDEYQDTNHLQAKIVQLLARSHGNITAVGDDAQSIYSFRGADFRNIMEFPNLFPGATVIRLEENYRSTSAILSLANQVMEHAVEKNEKTLYTRLEGGENTMKHTARAKSDKDLFLTARSCAT